jgi:hypothetical protein
MTQQPMKFATSDAYGPFDIGIAEAPVLMNLIWPQK